MKLKPDGIAEVIGLQIVEQLGNGEGGIATVVFAPETGLSVAFDDKVEHGSPIVRIVNFARAEGTAFQITMLVEHEQQITAGAVEMTVLS